MGFTSVAQSPGKMGMSLAFDSISLRHGLIFRSSTTFWLDRSLKLDNNFCLTESVIHVRWQKNSVFVLDGAEGDSSYPRRGRT